MSAQASTTLTLELPPDLGEQLRWLAQQRGQTFERLAARAIELFVQAAGPEMVSASAARRAANRAVFGDLAGLSLSSGQPKFLASPKPRWRIPYTTFDGTLMIEVEVDATTGAVLLSESERESLLNRVESYYSGRGQSSPA